VRLDRGIDTLSRFRGSLLGLAAGDALGTTLEFSPPGSFEPIDDMVGGGPFGLEPGQWTDDTSLALCLAESLVETGRLDLLDQLERYVRWYREGHLSSTGRLFDIGNATRAALERFERTGDPRAGSTDGATAGNGSLMRLAPVPLCFAGSEDAASAAAGESSLTTHGAPAAVDACRYLGLLVARAVRGAPKEEVLARPELELVPEVAAVAAGSFRAKEPPAIRGSGYVVESLEAALWAFTRSDTFRDGALLAVNLGDDADTTGAVYGQLTGAFYGEHAIPLEWRERLALRETIEELADGLFRRSGLVPTPESFWIEPGRLLAGKYAGASADVEAARRVRALAAAGITLVVDLTHADDRLAPYVSLLPAKVQRLSVPVPDFSAPSGVQLEQVLDAIDAELARGGAVYVHCWGGCGRTGAVVASWLVRQGLDADGALARFGELSRPVCGRRCPEVPAQLALVREYALRVGR
jgi:ADP-ribosyl-[dinitrogen reductase] hydrolase